MPDESTPYRSTQHLLAPPLEQQLAKEKEAIQVQAVLPILEDIVKHLDERIAFYQSVTAIDESVMANPDQFMHVVAANKLTVSNLQVEKTSIEELIRAHSK